MAHAQAATVAVIAGDVTAAAATNGHRVELGGAAAITDSVTATLAIDRGEQATAEFGGTLLDPTEFDDPGGWAR